MFPKITLLAKTEFIYPSFPNDAVSGGEALAEFAGRACYQSWTKPNPATATNAGYLKHILDTGHLSVLEHGSVSFYLEGVSRSLTHELVRHRHFAYSQLSQRYVNQDDTEFVNPPEAIGDLFLEKKFLDFEKVVIEYYTEIYEHKKRELAEKGIKGTEGRKRARQLARAVLPNETETKVVMTGNYRAWRHFIMMRAAEGADVEIRRLAIGILRELQKSTPAIFNDFQISEHTDGTEIATSIYHEEM